MAGSIFERSRDIPGIYSLDLEELRWWDAHCEQLRQNEINAINKARGKK